MLWLQLASQEDRSSGKDSPSVAISDRPGPTPVLQLQESSAGASLWVKKSNASVSVKVQVSSADQGLGRQEQW